MLAALPGLIVCNRQLLFFLLNAIIIYEYFFTQCSTVDASAFYFSVL